jgi:hypothetical protein
MAAQFLMNGMARLLAPMAAAFALGFLSRRSIILYGALGILASSVMFWWQDRQCKGMGRSRMDGMDRLADKNV